LSDNVGFSLFYDESIELLWVGTWGDGINLLNRNGKQIQHFQHNPEQNNSLNDDDFFTIYEDSQGRLWIGTEGGGLSVYDPINKSLKAYLHDPDDPESLDANCIYALCEDTDGNLWIGTRGAGLNILELPVNDTPVFSKIATQEGLASDWVLGIEEDKHGNLWVSCQGLSKISHDTREVRSYYFSESNQGAFYQSPQTGHFFLGAIGFDIFHPDSIKTEFSDPPILISSLDRFNAKEQSGIPIPVNGIHTFSALTLSYQDRILAFEFTSLDYDAETEAQYAYLLEGFNKDWLQLGTERKITFTGLPPGDYQLRVRTTKRSGGLGNHEASLTLNILPPWWQTLWARLIYILIGLSGLYGVFYWRSKLHKKKIQQKEDELANERQLNERLQQIDKLKDQFLANTSHELRTPLMGIIGLSDPCRMG